MNILGISAFYHDSAACLIQNGEIIAAAQEERFTRKKHDYQFPEKAIEYCIKTGKIITRDLDIVTFYEKPFIKFERLLQTYLQYAPLGLKAFIQAMPLWLKEKLWIKDTIAKRLDYDGKILFTEHHQSHAASAFYPSPFQEAAILTIDGVGEWTTSSYGIGKENNIKLLAELHFPHSLGLLYSAFTYYTGFTVNSGEYKMMGLAPYGDPIYTHKILNELIDLKQDGSFKLNMKYFNYCTGLTMTNHRFNKLFEGPPRKPESEITQREMNIARSIQEVTEIIMLRMATHVHQTTGINNLTLAGGVALNCVGNGRILKESPFENIWIQPAAGDAGGALGAALYTWHQYLGNKRGIAENTRPQKGSYLGPAYSNDEIELFLNQHAIPYTKLQDNQIAEKTADLIASGKVIGWFQGRMEFGPRALGNRSILADARSETIQSTINQKIKFRESFRPFAPSVLRERGDDYFELNCESPFMLLVAQLKEEKRIQNNNQKITGLDKLKIKRSDIPAVTHVDYSARIQTVDQADNSLYHDLIGTFYRKTGCPVIVNTSFNVRGEPIVCSPEDAYHCFIKTGMDYLILNNYLLQKHILSENETAKSKKEQTNKE